jgi:hypothetical protein
MNHRTLTSLAGLLPALAGAPLGAQEAPPVREPGLRQELIRRYAVDQQGRDSIAIALNAGDTAFVFRLMARDSASTAWLKGVVARYGWPGRSLVGDSGAAAAFLILQHSPDNAWQGGMLPTLWRLADQGELPKSDVAMLDDRVRMRQGLPQRYGMSFSMKDGCLVADPIEDPAGMAERRRGVGLPPMDEYMRKLGEVYQVKVVLSGGC